MTHWVGIDPGERRVGVARSDGLGMVAHPKAILGSYEELRDWLRSRSEEIEPPGGVIIGLPRNMDGSYGPLAKRSKTLIDRLRLDLPQHCFVLWDERLTSRQATQMVESTRSRAGQDRIDDKAAAVLLQSFLDAGCPLRSDPEELR